MMFKPDAPSKTVSQPNSVSSGLNSPPISASLTMESNRGGENNILSSSKGRTTTNLVLSPRDKEFALRAEG
jgi:hypothetical protein